VVEEQPAFRSFDRNRPGADLGLLPADGRSHDRTVVTPVAQVRALAVEDVAERRVAVVARAVQHRVLAADFARKQHPVAVERRKRVLQLMKLLEVEGVADSDRRPAQAVAPDHVPAVL